MELLKDEGYWLLAKGQLLLASDNWRTVCKKITIIYKHFGVGYPFPYFIHCVTVTNKMESCILSGAAYFNSNHDPLLLFNDLPVGGIWGGFLEQKPLRIER